MTKKPKAKRIGDLQQVDNAQRKFGSLQEYWFTRLQYPLGTEVPLLFTEAELLRAQARALKNPEDLLAAGIVRDLLD